MISLETELTYTPCQLEIFFENEGAKFKVIPKGRRLGFTRGASHACIDWCHSDTGPILWVDTINGNIERYYERYFYPALKQIPSKYWNWNQQKKVLKIFGQYIDFRSADAPESIEGFGYKKIILNEAGIILKNNYLYSNAVLPMLMDYPDSQLIAAGVPKGKYLKDGTKHKFYELWEHVIAGAPGYWGKKYSSYDNPLLTKSDIKEIEDEVSEAEAAQEIHAEFTETEGTNPFLHQYSETKHESKDAVLSQQKSLLISIDFNINPFAIGFDHKFRDHQGEHHHRVKEKPIDNGSVPDMIDYLNNNFGYWLPGCTMTGDSTGNNRQISQRDLASLFTQLRNGCHLSTTQIVVPNNPTHFESRNDCNYFLLHYPDFKLNPLECPETAKDMKRVQWDSVKQCIMKANRNDASQRADFMDTFRNSVNTFQKSWIMHHGKFKR